MLNPADINPLALPSVPLEDHSTISITTLSRICTALGISLDSLGLIPD